MAESPNPTGRRSFIAAPIPADVRAALFAACASLGMELPGVRWQRKIENLHVTIRFLGNVADDGIRDLGAALVCGLSGVPSFDLAVRGIGGFPSPRRANVIWAGIEDPSGGLGGIAALVDREVAVPGGLRVAERESRPFRAHVTLGRSKLGVDARVAAGSMSDRVFGRFTVDEVHLYESQLGRQGSTYVLRTRAALAPGKR